MRNLLRKNKFAVVLFAFGSSLIAYAYTTTSNMSLKIPVSGDTDYPTSISDSFTLIDAHDHTTGKGVQIPAGGIAANAITGAKLHSSIVDNSTIEINANALRVKDGGITKAKLAAPNIQVSSPCGTVAGTDYSFQISGNPVALTDVTGCTVTITVAAGRSVVLGFMDNYNAGNTFGNGLLYMNNAGAGGSSFDLAFVRGSTIISKPTLFPPGSNITYASSSSLSYIDTSPSTGSNTYKVQIGVTEGTFRIYNTRFYAYEL